MVQIFSSLWPNSIFNSIYFENRLDTIPTNSLIQIHILSNWPINTDAHKQRERERCHPTAIDWYLNSMIFNRHFFHSFFLLDLSIFVCLSFLFVVECCDISFFFFKITNDNISSNEISPFLRGAISRKPIVVSARREEKNGIHIDIDSIIPFFSRFFVLSLYDLCCICYLTYTHTHRILKLVISQTEQYFTHNSHHTSNLTRRYGEKIDQKKCICNIEEKKHSKKIYRIHK